MQRVGRTGRKREGFVHVLLAEGREETNWNKAREAYNDVQKCIVRGEQLELYDDVERLLPGHIKPQCLEMVMEIEEYDRSTTEKSRKSATQDPNKKRKRNDDPTRDIPPGASTGFVSVADLLVKQKGKKRKKINKFDENAGLDDETDEEIEAGLFVPRRAASTSATSTKPPKTKLKRAKTTVDGGKKRQTTRKKAKARAGAGSSQSSPSQFSRKGADDSKDMEIERGLWNNSHSPSPKPSPVHMRSSSPDIPLAQNQSIIDICTSAAPSPSPSPRRRYSSPTRPSAELPASYHHSPSPPNSPSVAPADAVVAPESDFGSLAPSKEASEQETTLKTNECEADDSLAWLLADSDDAGEVASSPVAGPRPRMFGSQGSDAIVIEDSEPENGSLIVLASSPMRPNVPPMSSREMPPPAIPPPRLPLGSSSPVAPPPSFPVRAAGQAKRRPVIALASDSSSPLRPPPPSQKRLHRRRQSDDDSSPSASPAMKRRKSRTTTKRLKVRDTAEAARAIPWIDVEARHSGDEVSSGESLLEEGESEGDGRFVTDLPATQASPSYDQSAVYRQSLLSQAPVSNLFSVPKFAAPPARRGVPLRGPPPAGPALDPGLRSRQERARRFSSPPPPDEEDYYMLGSFVVDDEAEISFSQSSEP